MKEPKLTYLLTLMPSVPCGIAKGNYILRIPPNRRGTVTFEPRG
jgi:hypothetical protein